MIKRLSSEEKAEIARRYQAGETSLALGSEYGIHHAFVRTIFQRSGMGRDRAERCSKRAAIIAALEADKTKTDSRVAIEVGCSRPYVYLVRQSIGIFRNRTSKHLLIELSDCNALLFQEAARRRGMAVTRLAAKILDTVATEGMFDAVLDDVEAAA
ncbi:hypothetical protein [Mesorhizobium sp. Pch-S]|uniref:hypothetical protein n=1 Tax=Mesorhizobium sp. Pch-S TaxID=2082387 RepID=UPI001011086E|nr:hypothetical protein [Mesorhizobium sp. Pch-S]